MSDTVTGETRSRVHLPDLVAGVMLAVVFGIAFVIALGWSGKAAIFPLGVSGLGTVLGLAFVIRSLRSGGRRPTAQLSSLGDNDEDTDDALEYAFGTADRREWAVALGCFAGFFVALYVLGLYLAAPLFTLIYLRWQAGRGWTFSIVYTAILFAVLYGAFSLVLQLPVPAGVFSGR